MLRSNNPALHVNKMSGKKAERASFKACRDRRRRSPLLETSLMIIERKVGRFPIAMFPNSATA